MTIPSQLSAGDVKLLRQVMSLFTDYAYLEIGSYLGGSLHFHLTNPACVHAWSVDTRLTGDIRDERHLKYQYTVTTQDMLSVLERNSIPTGRLTTIDGTVRDMPDTLIDLVFIDGEHTNLAAWSDAEHSMRFNPSVILFHDDWIVSEGIEQFADQLESQGQQFDVLKFENSDITGVVFGTMRTQFHSFPTVAWQQFAPAAEQRLKEYNERSNSTTSL